MQIQTKSIFTSRVFWIATIQAVAGAIAIFTTSFPAVGWLVIAKSVVDVALRFTTDIPVSVFGGIKQI